MNMKWIKIYDKNNPSDIVHIEGVNTLQDVLKLFAKPDETKIKWMNQETGKVERVTYKCMVRDERYVILSKPFNAKETFMYTIFDLEEMICGSDDHRCMYKYDDKDECEKALADLQNDILHISYRSRAKIEDCVAEVWTLAERV